ncbi:hypothetical protein TCAL_09322 [Tigriopus californicus]|uniref:Uncharacterized protein n=1 Tax=Tigriopus californicus TaxID=6832 RepID=A0A553PQW7_TIGCA|nr:uncharacterized protein LOC131881500 [Tigriopus californicus]TRY80074.1 hypothetical protein TCAL_09322 [Tigriopus californicus]|eukprot:TCALIF_09322-PA protein Name:"Protein of unknown function" AED:0.00 eAED:0.00 QI:182/1/1/1/0.5/0.33/3/1246/157
MGQQLCCEILKCSKCSSSYSTCQQCDFNLSWLRRLCFCVLSCCTTCCDSSSGSQPNPMGLRKRSSSPNEGPDIPLAQIDAMERRKTRRSLASVSNKPSKDSSSCGGGHQFIEVDKSLLEEGISFQYVYNSNDSVDMEGGIRIDVPQTQKLPLPASKK